MKLEIKRNTGASTRRDLVVPKDYQTKALLEVDDVEAGQTNPTEEVGVVVLKRDKMQRPLTIQVSGEIFRASEKPRIINLRGGWGAQDISKREKLIVRP